MDNVDTMRSIPASQCEGEAPRLCRSGRRSDVSTNTRAHKSNTTQHIGHLNKGKGRTHKAPVVTFSALLI